ncbi:hypothetical protein MP228_006237 [Amoeboaphelidium protococcarum]|nr:hypothetical protein MP228_006237 [Amoeboaphelidium protococcarum]
MENSNQVVAIQTRPQKVFTAGKKVNNMMVKSSKIPQSILECSELNDSIRRILPQTYNFEIHKCIHQIRSMPQRSQRIGLQLPEGLQMFAMALSAIFTQYLYYDYDGNNDNNNNTGQDNTIDDDRVVDVVVLADVTYGACCIDDFTASALGCDVLIHYGHSCLVPITTTSLVKKVIYVFVDIRFDITHFQRTFNRHFIDSQINSSSGSSTHDDTKSDDVRHNSDGSGRSNNNSKRKLRVVLVGTIQFASSLHLIAEQMAEYCHVTIPQARPLSRGEILGCTSPTLNGMGNKSSLSGGGGCGDDKDDERIDLIIYIGDGRFHLESMMIANPQYLDRFYKYDPYECKFTKEGYEYVQMTSMRRDAIELARSMTTITSTSTTTSQSNSDEEQRRPVWALLVGTLGRQGSPAVVKHLKQKIKTRGYRCVQILISEVSIDKLKQFEDKVDVFVQTSCPRLSIDWGYLFPKPLLTPYEATVALMEPDEYRQSRPSWMKCQSQSKQQQLSSEQESQLCGNKGENCCKPGDNYPMDFYAKDSLGPWTPNHVPPKTKQK